MPINLAALVRKRQPRRKYLRVKAKALPPAIEQALAAIYLQVPRRWAEQARDRIVPAYRTLLGLDAVQNGYTADDTPTLEGQLAASESDTLALVATLTPDLRDWTLRAEAVHRGQFVSALSDATNIDLASVLSSSGVGDTLAASLARNVSLVRSVSDDIRKSIADLTYSSWQRRDSVVDLAKAIDEATGLGKARALRIARDQTTKLAAALDRERQDELGFTQFTWRHSGKLHYRPAHKARDGKVFDNDDPALKGDMPGDAVNCGCKGEAYMDLEAYEAARKEAGRQAAAAVAEEEGFGGPVGVPVGLPAGRFNPIDPEGGLLGWLESLFK